ncbi:MAG: four helix bundle protein [Candidatus Sifarchaeia archaeon]|jgi:four helix bundle protein
MKNQSLNLKTRTYNFSREIIKFVATFPNTRVYWVISDQLLRSATSIGANIIEAQAASSKRDFIKFFQIALKSANETAYWLNLLKDATKVDQTKVNKLLKEVDELAKMLGASLLTMKGKRKV